MYTRNLITWVQRLKRVHNSSFCMDFHKLKSIHSVIFCIFPHSESLQKRNISRAVAHEHRDVPGTLRQWKIRGKSSGLGGFPMDFPWISPWTGWIPQKGRILWNWMQISPPKSIDSLGITWLWDTLGTFPPRHETQIALPPLGLKKKQQIWRILEQHTWNARNIAKSTSRYGSIDSSELYWIIE